MAEIERDPHIASPGSLGDTHNVSEPGQVKAIVWIERDAKVGLRREIGDSIDRLDRPLFCSARRRVITLNGHPYGGSAPLQRLDRGFHIWLIFDLAIADVHRHPKKEQLEMRVVQGSQSLGNLPRMIEDRSRKSILARKTGLLLGTNIAELVRKHGVGQPGGGPAVESSRLDLRQCDARGCSTFDKLPTARKHHVVRLLKKDEKTFFGVFYLPPAGKERLMMRRSKTMLALSLLALMTGVCFAAEGPHIYTLAGDFAGTHDPSIIKSGKTWYVFATGKAPDGSQLAVRCSQDLVNWKLCGHVFAAIPDWIRQRSPGTKDLWAPDISYVNHQYRLYYAYSLFGKNTSGIALATNTTLDPASPDFQWIDRGLVLESKAGDNYNAIDPNFVLDQKRGAWLVFGSFWDGIKMRRLDDAGMLSKQDTTLYSLARRVRPENAEPAPPNLPANREAIEAPFIVHHDRLLLSFYLVGPLLPGHQELL